MKKAVFFSLFLFVFSLQAKDTGLISDPGQSILSLKKIYQKIESYTKKYPDDDCIEIEELRVSLDHFYNAIIHLEKESRRDSFIGHVVDYVEDVLEHINSTTSFFLSFLKSEHNNFVNKDVIVEIFAQILRIENLVQSFCTEYREDDDFPYNERLRPLLKVKKGYVLHKLKSNESRDLFVHFLIEQSVLYIKDGRVVGDFSYESKKKFHQTLRSYGKKVIDRELKYDGLYERCQKKIKNNKVKESFSRDSFFSTLEKNDENLQVFVLYNLSKEFIELSLKKLKVDKNIFEEKNSSEQVIYMSTPVYDCSNVDFSNCIDDYQKWFNVYKNIKLAGVKVILAQNDYNNTLYATKWTRDHAYAVHDDETTYLLWSDAKTGHGKHQAWKNPYYLMRQKSKSFIKEQDDSIEHISIPRGEIEGGNTLYYPATKTLFIGISDGLQDYHDIEIYRESLDNAGLNHIKIIPIYFKTTREMIFYHLDTFMNRVGEQIILFKGAVTEESFQKIQNEVGSENIYSLHFQEAVHYVTNYIQVGKKLIIPKIPKSKRHGIYNYLKDLGYQLIIMDAVDSGYGGPHCITLDIGKLPDIKSE